MFKDTRLQHLHRKYLKSSVVEHKRIIWKHPIITYHFNALLKINSQLTRNAMKQLNTVCAAINALLTKTVLLGSILTNLPTLQFSVTGAFKDIPETSHFFQRVAV